MKTFWDFKYSLNFRLLAGGVRSMGDLAALRSLLVEIAQNESSILGRASVALAASGEFALADELIDIKTKYVGMIEMDIQAIDAYTALVKRSK